MNKRFETLTVRNAFDDWRRQLFLTLGQRYLIGWIAVAACLLIDAVWLWTSGYSVEMGTVATVAKSIALKSCVVLGLGAVAAVPRYVAVTKKLRYPQIINTFAWVLLLSAFISAAAIVSYLSVTVSPPLIDADLIRFDQALGFDWLQVYHWVHAHPAVQQVLALAYQSGLWQLVGVPVVLGILGRYDDLSDFAFRLMISISLVILISTPFPAESAFVHFHITDPNTASTVSDFDLLRSGALRHFDLTHTQGLVSFPSFHVALAVLFAWSVRRVRVLFPFVAALDVLMILSTPTQGGHYLADVFGGVALAFATIYALRFIQGKRFAVRRALPANVAAG